MNQRSIKINQAVASVSILNISDNKLHSDSSLPNLDNVKLDTTSLLPGDDSDLNERILFLEKSLSEAKDKFYQLGYNEGKNDGMKELDIISEKQSTIINETLSKLNVEYEKAIDKLAEPMVNLSIKIAEKIISDDLSNKEDISSYLEKKVLTLVDKLKIFWLTNKIGHRKSWIFLMQLFMGISLLVWSNIEDRKSTRLNSSH